MPPNFAIPASSEPFHVKLAVRVLTGRIGIGIETRDQTRFLRYKMPSPEECNDWQVLELTTPPLADCGCLVVNNAFADGGSRAEVRILEIAKLSPPGGVAAPGSIRAAYVTVGPTS